MRRVLWMSIIILFTCQAASALELSEEPLQALAAVPTNPEKSALGKRLFFDTRLSRDNSISCAHCHHLEQLGGADGLKHSFGVEGQESMLNSPTVFNAALNFVQFWDGRASSLEDQIDGPITGHAEMANNWKNIVKTLRADRLYRKTFSRLYNTGITQRNIKHAIAEFERTLITVDSRFDQYLNGDETAITATEKHGYRLFKSYGCASCHQGRNVGGNLFQPLGIMGDYFADHPAENSAARGRFNVTADKADMHRFKVPSLRMVVLTSPYFHNGSQKNLGEAIRTMAKYQLGRTIPDQDLNAIIAFLYTLPGKYDGHTLEPGHRRQRNLSATGLPQ